MMSCKHCGLTLVSELGVGTYVMLAIFTTLITFATGLPFVLALAAKAWLAALAIAVVFLLWVLPVYMIAHARAVRAQTSDLVQR
jgi:hypothetical protein